MVRRLAEGEHVLDAASLDDWEDGGPLADGIDADVPEAIDIVAAEEARLDAEIDAEIDAALAAASAGVGAADDDIEHDIEHDMDEVVDDDRTAANDATDDRAHA